MSSTISEKYINQFVRNKPYEKIAEMKYNMVQQYHRAPLVHRIQVSLTNAAILFYEFCLIMYKINKSGKFTLKKCCNFYQSEHSLLHYLAPNLSSNSKLCIPLLKQPSCMIKLRQMRGSQKPVGQLCYVYLGQVHLIRQA